MENKIFVKEVFGSHVERICEKYGRQEVITAMRKFNNYCIEREKEKNGKI